MNLDDFIITCFCVIDEMLPRATKGQRLRQHGPMPKLADSEVITLEVVETYLGLSQDQEIFDYFRRHCTHFFPEMARVVRTTWLRQATNLWAVIERLWCLIRDTLLLYDPTVAIVDSMPIPVCQFARAYRCHRFDEHGQLWQGSYLSADLLRLSAAHAAVLAKRHHADVPGSGQCA